jgi:hypothetical protein
MGEPHSIQQTIRVYFCLWPDHPCLTIIDGYRRLLGKVVEYRQNSHNSLIIKRISLIQNAIGLKL